MYQKYFSGQRSEWLDGWMCDVKVKDRVPSKELRD